MRMDIVGKEQACIPQGHKFDSPKLFYIKKNYIVTSYIEKIYFFFQEMYLDR